jgi:hypothetical protein
LASSAGASIEEFESWDLGAEEADDEYGMDLFLSTFTPEWQRGWRASHSGVRFAMGCVTRERWETLTQARMQHELSRRASFRYEFVQEDRLGLNNLQHTFGFEVEAKDVWFGGYARPEAAKERHDFGLTVRRSWREGYYLGIALTHEDALNDFWTDRSFVEERVRVDFLDRAWEWRLSGGRIWSERRALRVAAVLLPQFQRRIEPRPSSGHPDTLRTLDGSHLILNASIDLRSDVDLDLHVARKEAHLASFLQDGRTGSDLHRLAWIWTARLDHPLYGRWRALWGVQLRRNREQDVAGGAGSHRLRVRELMAALRFRRPLAPWLAIELGYAYEDVDVKQSGAETGLRFTHGTRSEQRAILVGEINLRGVRVRLIETLEIDGESYDVVGVHDKGFVQIQVVF